jgi:hypothetical protein
VLKDFRDHRRRSSRRQTPIALKRRGGFSSHHIGICGLSGLKNLSGNFCFSEKERFGR